MMGTGSPTCEKNGINAFPGVAAHSLDYPYKSQNEEEMFSMITKPWVRYDVEVVTKLIVYSGSHCRPSFNLVFSLMQQSFC